MNNQVFVKWGRFHWTNWCTVQN